MRLPNIILVVTDQHARRVSGCYGDSIVRTPNLDALVPPGKRIDRCHPEAI